MTNESCYWKKFADFEDQKCSECLLGSLLVWLLGTVTPPPGQREREHMADGSKGPGTQEKSPSTPSFQGSAVKCERGGTSGSQMGLPGVLAIPWGCRPWCWLSRSLGLHTPPGKQTLQRMEAHTGHWCMGGGPVCRMHSLPSWRVCTGLAWAPLLPPPRK